MKTTGTVLAAADGTATVRVFRESPCAACKGCAGGACHAEFTFDSDPVGITVNAHDPIGVHKGDVVELYSENRFTLGLAFALFGLPFVIAVLLGGVTGALVSAGWGIGCGIAAFVLSFVALAFCGDRVSAAKNKTVITKIMKESGSDLP